MTKRKRYNPLEEESPEADAHEQIHAVAAIGKGMRGEEAFDKVERIERLRPSQMMPDRFQPRRLLPSGIRRQFFRLEIDCYQAAREWIGLAEMDEGWRKQIQELLDMGGSFKEQGQIKPITGSWIPSPGGGYIFQIETGERRFWAACLSKVKKNAAGEPELRVEVISSPTRQRQVLENRHAQSPSAVGQACEVAALMLEEMGIEPEPDVEDEYEYFRQALKGRAPRGLWPKLEPLMQHSTRRMQQLLAILQLPTPLLEVADRHRIPERLLREVLALPQERWESAIEAAQQEGFTSEDVALLDRKPPKERKGEDARRSPERIAFSGLRSFTRMVMNVDKEERAFLLDGVADEVVVEGFGEELLQLLEGLRRRIDARLKGRE
jgi:hypothetical protein